MEDAVDKYFTPTILHESPITQEMCYKDILNYCKILQGKEWPWSELYLDVQRANTHNRIAEACDCDSELVTKAFDESFPNDYATHSIDDDFLKRVDKWFNRLKGNRGMARRRAFSKSDTR